MILGFVGLSLRGNYEYSVFRSVFRLRFEGDFVDLVMVSKFGRWWGNGGIYIFVCSINIGGVCVEREIFF